MNELRDRILTTVKDDLVDIEKALADNLNPYLDLVSDVAGHIHGTGDRAGVLSSDVDAEGPRRRQGHVGSEDRNRKEDHGRQRRRHVDAADQPARREEEDERGDPQSAVERIRQVGLVEAAQADAIMDLQQMVGGSREEARAADAPVAGPVRAQSR